MFCNIYLGVWFQRKGWILMQKFMAVYLKWTSKMLSPAAEELCHLPPTGNCVCPWTPCGHTPRFPLHPILVCGPALQTSCAVHPSSSASDANTFNSLATTSFQDFLGQPLISQTFHNAFSWICLRVHPIQDAGISLYLSGHVLSIRTSAALFSFQEALYRSGIMLKYYHSTSVKSVNNQR